MSSNDPTDQLEALRQKRGFLLPHHGLMAIAMPEVLSAYDTLYSRLAYSPGVLSERDHEFVWLAILAARDEGLATHHVARFLDAGGRGADIEGLLAIVATAAGCRAWQFADRAWSAHVPGLDAATAYLEAFRRGAGDIALPLAHLAGIATQVCRGNWAGLRWQLRGAYADRSAEDDIAHALALTMFPGSVPNFAQAARVWRELILAGEIDAGEDYRAWAEYPGQGGYDEASGGVNG
ncbi:MAG: carboxymuconolactone decarboxylase family protein [Pseudomonadota bacterium]